ncbi:MAG: ferritin-like domain-containing protein [Oscillospiraceae bacterium]|nr:ferritin-like domain-containing protein [Oscillospiraceae bacterium]
MAQDFLNGLAGFPYPPVRVEAKNPAYARIMLGNIGDQNSETSSFALYLYNQVITSNDPELSAAFRAVAETERRHLELLSQMAFQLGADPRMWAVTGNAAQPMRWWSPGLLTYTANTRSMLQNALALERATIAKYERQAQEIRDDGVLLLLRRILLDESMHVEVFRSLLDALDARTAAQASVSAQPALPPVAAAPATQLPAMQAPVMHTPMAVAQPTPAALPLAAYVPAPQALGSQQILPQQAQI